MTPRRGLGLPGTISDFDLCQLMLEKASLTDDQLVAVTDAATHVAAGRTLLKETRDRFIAIGKAQGFMCKETPKRKQPEPPHATDFYSTMRTRGTMVAEVILARGKTPSGKMIAPPGRKKTG